MKTALANIAFCIAGILLVVYSGFVDAAPNVNRAGKRADATIAVTNAHSELHKGRLFSVVRNATLNDGQAITLLVTTPPINEGCVHMFVRSRSSSEARYAVYFAPTITNSGTAMIENNHNDQSSRIASTVVTHSPTVTDLGTLREGWSKHFGSGQTTGGESRSENERMLRPDSAYLVNAVSESATNDVTLGLVWYENGGDAP